MSESTKEYPWYAVVAGDTIEQGDLLLDFDVFVPGSDGSPEALELEGELKTFDLVVMTQTCDIGHGKVRSLLLCPWWELWRFIEAAKERGEKNWGRDQREALRRGNLPGYHLLDSASFDDLRIGLGVVDFHEVYTAPTDRVREFAKQAVKRLRLCPPYREHLAQAFARFFMRVGLPADIPAERLKAPPATE
ncbi:MAG: hypothetical protein WD066_15360 [Planctomycetaceae bacterium]